MAYPVSVCIIAKNEEKHIEGCLKHLMPYDMEIIVADTGSTDKTKEIAGKYTDNVYDFEWIDDFSAARNFCASKAKNNWILVIDCDEYVESINTCEMRMFMQKHPKSTGKINIRNIAHRNNGEVSCVEEYIPRFYNKNFYEFAYPVHENIVLKKDADKQFECFELPIKVVHHGYNIDKEEMQEKQERNLKLLYQMLENGDKRDGYTYFQVGQSEQLIGNLDKAIENYLECLKISQKVNSEYINKCIIQLATAYAQIDEPQKAVELMESYKDKIKSAGFIYTYALALLGTGEILKALTQLVLVTTMNDSKTLGDDLICCYQYIIKIYHEFGEDNLSDIFKKRCEEYIHEQETS